MVLVNSAKKFTTPSILSNINTHMASILKYIRNIWFKKRNSERKARMFLWEPRKAKTPKKTYTKRKNIHFQTRLDMWGQKKILFYSYISIFALLLSGILFLSLSSKFTVKNIEIIRQDNISDINIAYNAVNSFRWKSIFRVDRNKIINRIYSYQNNVNAITIESSLPDTLIVYIGSAPQLFNTVIDELNYIVTSNGVVVPEKPNTTLKDLSIIFRKAPSGIIAYKQILSPRDIMALDTMVKWLEKNILNIAISGISYLPMEHEIHIALESQTLLIFDIKEDIADQIEKIAIFHNEQQDITKESITYIDARIPKKIFYCSNETRWRCNKNLTEIYGQ